MMGDEVVETYTGRITRSVVKKLKKRPLSPTPLYFSATRRRTKNSLESGPPSTTSVSKKRTRASRRSSAAASIQDEDDNESENVDEDNGKKERKRDPVEDNTEQQQFSNPITTPHTQHVSASTPTSPTTTISASSSRGLSNSSKLSPLVSPAKLSIDANHQGTIFTSSLPQGSQQHLIKKEVGDAEAKNQEKKGEDADVATGKEEQTFVRVHPSASEFTLGIEKKGIFTGRGGELFDVLWSQYWGILIVAITIVYPIFLLVLAGCYVLGFVESFAAVLGCIGLVYAALLCVIISTFLTSVLPAILLLQSI